MNIVKWLMALSLVISLQGAAAAEEPKKAAEAAEPAPQNLEIIIQKNSGGDMAAWTGQLFSLPTGKPAQRVSPEQRRLLLPEGNYLLMLNFDETAGDMKGQHPFTFTIAADATTTFLLTIGRSNAPEIEYGVGRTGADFVEGETRKGRDYINFELPTPDPKLCLTKCKSDRNCDVYSYGKLPEWPKARCWLIHGAAAITVHSPYAASGIIQRDSSPYQLQITSEKR